MAEDDVIDPLNNIIKFTIAASESVSVSHKEIVKPDQGNNKQKLKETKKKEDEDPWYNKNYIKTFNVFLLLVTQNGISGNFNFTDTYEFIPITIASSFFRCQHEFMS